MKKFSTLFLLLFLLLFLSSHSLAQSSDPTAVVRFGPNLPTTCNPSGPNIFFKTTTTVGLYQCLTSNTWTAVAGGGGGSQTPWTSAIDGDGFALSDTGDLIPRAGSSLGSAAIPWLSTFTGNTTQYESVTQSAGLITHAALGSATNIGITLTPKGSGVLTLGVLAGGIVVNGGGTLNGTFAFEDNTRQTFNPGGGNSGLNVGSHTSDPTSPANGDIFYNSTSNTFRFRENGAWVALGGGGGGTVTVVGGGSLTSTALVTGGGTTTVQTVSATATLDSSGNISTPGSLSAGVGSSVAGTFTTTEGTAPSLVANSFSIYSPTDVAVGGLAFVLPGTAGSGILTVTNSSGVMTIGTPGPLSYKFYFASAGCNNTTASSFWDLPTATPAVPACVTGTNTQKGVLDFPDTAGGFSAQTNFLLPSDFTSTIDATIIWSTTATTGNIEWSLSSICTATNATETDDPAFNTPSTVVTAAPGIANRIQTSTITGLTITGCAAGEFLHLRIFRDGNDAQDTIAATARLFGIEITTRRTP